MRITSIAYSEYQESPRNWHVEEINFEAVNLVVGRNAVGKTRLLNVVNGLAQLVSGRREPMVTGKYVAEFKSKDSTYKYEISFHNKAVTHEHLREKTGKGHYLDLLKRNEKGVGKIRTKTRGKEFKLVKFQSPVDQVGVFARQDAINHPFLLDFVEWGRSTFHFNFGIGEVREVAIFTDLAASEYDPLDTKKFLETFQRGIDEFGDTFKQELLNDFAKIGYQIDDISIDAPADLLIKAPIAGRLGVIAVKERGVQCDISTLQLSSGMLRAFSLLIQINYRAMAMSPSCFIIDDIGEGLDFDRCCSLIDLLMEKSKQSNIQILMSTNDRFVMNRLPLNCWILLDRDGSNVRAMTYRKNRKVFENFKFTGLSNFDFFTRHYIRPSNDQD